MGKKFFELFLYFGVIPLGLSFIPLAFMGVHVMIASLVPLILGGVLVGFFSSKRLQGQGKLKEHAIVFLLPLAYTAVLWAIFMLITGGFSGADAWFVYCIFHIAMAPIFFVALLMGEGRLFLWAPLAYELSFVIGVLLTVLIKRDWKAFGFNRKQLLSVLTVFVLAMGTGATVQWQRSKTVLPSYGFEYGGGYSSTDLDPYEVMNPENKLPKLREPATLQLRTLVKCLCLTGQKRLFLSIQPLQMQPMKILIM